MPIWNGIIFDAEAYDLDEEDGVYYFDDIIGQVQPKQKIIDVTNRPGVPGETFRNMGEWAEPSLLTTIHYVADRAAAKAAINAYLAMKDGLGRQLFQHGEDWGFVRIKHIRPRPLQPVASAAGTLIANPTILQIIDWEVISTTEPPAEEP